MPLVTRSESLVLEAQDTWLFSRQQSYGQQATEPPILVPVLELIITQRCCRLRSMRTLVAAWLAVLAAAEPVERREIRSVDEFRRLVQTSPRVFLVEFFSGMCGYCQEFEPTWLELARTTTRLTGALEY